jgi:hypothetical protein
VTLEVDVPPVGGPFTSPANAAVALAPVTATAHTAATSVDLRRISPSSMSFVPDGT